MNPILNLFVIKDPVEVDLHTIRGKLRVDSGAEHEVEVRRRLVGWSVRIQVSVNGIQLHDACPHPSEISDFEKLREIAYGIDADKRKETRLAAHAVCKKIGLY